MSEFTRFSAGPDQTVPAQVSVIIGTRNRGDKITHTIKSIMSGSYQNFQIIIVDQSDDNITKQSLNPYLEDSRISYIRSDTSGLGTAQNIGIGEARTEIIALTDDDCRPHHHWLAELIKVFEEEDHSIGIVFGNVATAPYDREQGFIPAYLCKEKAMVKNIYQRNRIEGIGACMGLRRSVWQKLNGFDPLLGPGAKLRSGVETDFTLRALLEGFYIYQTPDFEVLHDGFRNWNEGAELVRDYLHGTGAVFGKLLKCGHVSILYLLSGLAWRFVFGQSSVVLGEQNYKGAKLSAFIGGFMTALRNPVSRRTRLFVN